MRKFAGILFAAVLALTGTGCGSNSTEQAPPPPPSHIEQVNTLVADLGKLGMVIDEIEDKTVKEGKRRNAHFEQETGAKERKVIKCSGPAKNRTCKTETTKITTKQYVAEVTVVVAGNCKAQIERLLDVGSTSHYFDETWSDRGDDIPVGMDSPFSFMPASTTLETYFSELGPQPRDFDFCRGKGKTLSPAGRN